MGLCRSVHEADAEDWKMIEHVPTLATAPRESWGPLRPLGHRTWLAARWSRSCNQQLQLSSGIFSSWRPGSLDLTLELSKLTPNLLTFCSNPMGNPWESYRVCSAHTIPHRPLIWKLPAKVRNNLLRDERLQAASCLWDGHGMSFGCHGRHWDASGCRISRKWPKCWLCTQQGQPHVLNWLEGGSTGFALFFKI